MRRTSSTGGPGRARAAAPLPPMLSLHHTTSHQRRNSVTSAAATPTPPSPYSAALDGAMEGRSGEARGGRPSRGGFGAAAPGGFAHFATPASPSIGGSEHGGAALTTEQLDAILATNLSDQKARRGSSSAGSYGAQQSTPGTATQNHYFGSFFAPPHALGVPVQQAGSTPTPPAKGPSRGTSVVGAAAYPHSLPGAQLKESPPKRG